jgi:tRNA-2-methylthio-N6-dimethylallyladenosine synthase
MTETKPPKFYTETFGCQMNAADSEEMGRALLARGFAPAGTREEADWLLVNTCTVRDHAEHRALSFLGRLKEWKASSPSRRIVVAGCAAERLKDELGTRFPHVDLVVGAKSIGAFAGLLDPLLPAAAREPFNGRGEQEGAWAAETDYTSFLSADAVTGHVTIMRGCNYSCTYCIVPAVRGREVYRPAESVLAEVRQKAARGLSEIMLLGQTVNSYRPAAPGPADFAELLRAVDAVPGVRRIRYMSPHPFYVTEKFAKTLSECANVCPHIHLPVQSGSDAVLKRMRRNYARAEYLEKLALLRGRDRGGLPRHALARRGGRHRRGLLLQIFAAPRHGRRGAGRRRASRGQGGAPGPPAGEMRRAHRSRRETPFRHAPGGSGGPRRGRRFL